MIKIICIGTIKEDYLKKLINDYLTRINKYHKITIIELKEEPSLIKEAQNILSKIDNKDYVITLDINGKEYSSPDFAKLIDNTFVTKSTITFVIGSSYGLDELVKKRSNLALSFGKLTYPHGLFRGILLEQIYRAFKINNHEEYHK